jgi:transposase
MPFSQPLEQGLAFQLGGLWRRLKPYEKFARMIERHWDGIAAYCRAENKVPLGFVEGVNNKIRSIQKRAYGLRDEEYLRLKILTCMLEKL